MIEVDHTRDTGRYVCPGEFSLQFGKTALLMAQWLQKLWGLCSSLKLQIHLTYSIHSDLSNGITGRC